MVDGIETKRTRKTVSSLYLTRVVEVLVQARDGLFFARTVVDRGDPVPVMTAVKLLLLIAVFVTGNAADVTGTAVLVDRGVSKVLAT